MRCNSNLGYALSEAKVIPQAREMDGIKAAAYISKLEKLEGPEKECLAVIYSSHAFGVSIERIGIIQNLDPEAMLQFDEGEGKLVISLVKEFVKKGLRVEYIKPKPLDQLDASLPVSGIPCPYSR